MKTTHEITIKCSGCGENFTTQFTREHNDTQRIAVLAELAVQEAEWIIEDELLYCPDCDGRRVGKTVVFCKNEFPKRINEFQIGKIFENEDGILKIQSPTGIFLR